ncbi:unnamed protein product [Didymodactylos carnosus]|uniref:Kinesin light chain n=1 Tax=Didymodactylos carnosus TaxID=1234261 RepID=A0A8S2EEY8_9BILA|nr:unnamed protein product [Didymodactylos carnosus]CAF3967152.1 unnamed protein product [Didymodactylos carnosus]
MYCEDKSVRPQMEPIIFEIHINDTTAEINNSVAYASIRNLSYFKSEDEILFCVGVVFRIVSVKQHPNDVIQIWYIKLELCKENDLESLHNYFSILISAQEEITLVILGKRFRKMGDLQRAGKYYYMLLQELSSDHELMPATYNNLGTVYIHNGNCKRPLLCYNKSKKLLKAMTTTDKQGLALVYNGIGLIYSTIQKWKLAEHYCLKALNLQTKYKTVEKHPHMAMTCNALGWIYARTKQYEKAFEMYHRAVDINVDTLPEYHSEIPTTLSNLAGLYKDTKDYKIANHISEKKGKDRFLKLLYLY